MALLEKLAVAWSQLATGWKTLAGCAICATVVGGMIEDVRHAVFGPVVSFVSKLSSSPDDQFDACLADHLWNTPRPAPGPFHVFVTVPLGDDGRSQFRLIDRNLRAQFGEDVSSVVQVESSDCLILQPASGLAAKIEETASMRGQAVLSRTGADVVIWGEVKNANKKLRLRFLTKGDAADNIYGVIETADELLLEPDFGEGVGAMIAAKTLTLTTLSVEEQSVLLTPSMELALRITAPLVKEMPAGLDGDAKGAIQFSHAMALFYLGTEKGEAELLEQSVTAFRGALEEWTRDHLPLQWARAQMNLGNALGLLGRLRADVALLHQAEAAYRSALEEWTRDSVPLQWARVQVNLGNALKDLAKLETGTARLEQAVAAYRAALEENLRARIPLGWAITQMNLCAALTALGTRESSTVRLETGLSACRAALLEFTRDRVPLQWARTQVTLGNALTARGYLETGTTAGLEQAVAAYRAALEEIPRNHMPLQWAVAQVNLANTLLILGQREDGTARLEQALEAFRAALAEYSEDRAPIDWAIALGNEGVTLLILADRRNNPLQAQEALEKLTLAEATLRSGGHILSADYYASQIPVAEAWVDWFSGGQP